MTSRALSSVSVRLRYGPLGVVDRRRMCVRRRRDRDDELLPCALRRRRGGRRARRPPRRLERRRGPDLPRQLGDAAHLRAADRAPSPEDARAPAHGHRGAHRAQRHGPRADRQRRGGRLREDRGRGLDRPRVRRRSCHRAGRESPSDRDPRRHRARRLKGTPVAALIVLGVLILFAIYVAAKTVRVIPQARAGVVERLGRYSRTLSPGLTIVVPFVDRVKPLIDLREQVVAFKPQPVITEDNVTVQIDTVLYFTITEPKSATYEVANPLQAIEQLTITTLRNVIGGLTLEETLTSRDNVNTQLRVAPEGARGRGGTRITRGEIKPVDPPASIQEAMEKQMRAERDRRAAILTAEGVKQSAILTAEGEKQSAVLKAEGAKQAAILRAEGEASAIDTVFRAIHEGGPDQALLSYQYLQMLPQLAQGDANKVFVIPSEFSQAAANLGSAITRAAGPPPPPPPPA